MALYDDYMAVDLTNLTDEEMDALIDPGQKAVIHYLNKTEAAARLNLKSPRSLTGVPLPPHDAEIGERKGWRPETIDSWKVSRPGRGRWGPRSEKPRESENPQ